MHVTIACNAVCHTLADGRSLCKVNSVTKHFRVSPEPAPMGQVEGCHSALVTSTCPFQSRETYDCPPGSGSLAPAPDIAKVACVLWAVGCNFSVAAFWRCQCIRLNYMVGVRMPPTLMTCIGGETSNNTASKQAGAAHRSACSKYSHAMHFQCPIAPRCPASQMEHTNDQVVALSGIKLVTDPGRNHTPYQQTNSPSPSDQYSHRETGVQLIQRGHIAAYKPCSKTIPAARSNALVEGEDSRQRHHRPILLSTEL